MNIELTSQLKGKQEKTLVVLVASQTNTKDVTTLVSPGSSKAVNSFVQEQFNKKLLTSTNGDTLFFRATSLEEADSLLLVCIGSKKKLSAETFRSAAGVTHSCLKREKVQHGFIDLNNLKGFSPKSVDANLGAFIEGIVLSSFSFDGLKTKKIPTVLQNFSILSNSTSAALKNVVQSAVDVSESVNYSKWLGDMPGNLMTPAILANSVVKEAKNIAKLNVSIWNKARIQKERMGGLLAVSAGSIHEPRFIIMEYNGAAKSKKPLCLVGKGLTFDCGGISIKPSSGMEEMKYDMCGGANVIGAMLAIAKLKLKVNVVAYVPSTENMPGKDAIKPGDVITARNGLSVEVNNTDAEGRLILMDALSYACEKKPGTILDTATLTGAILVALSNIYTGVFTPDQKLMSKINRAADKSGELVWQMPLNNEHIKDMKGAYADLSNLAATRGGGSSTAAAFLSHFVTADIPWAHFDIAGTAWSNKERLTYTDPRGATGAIVRTFVEFAKAYS